MKREIKIASKTKETYEAPVIETIEVRVEQGFQGSGELGNDPNDDDPGGSY